jgi:biotin operon repressor
VQVTNLGEARAIGRILASKKKSLILVLLSRYGALSKSKIASMLKVGCSTVNEYIEDFVASGIAEESLTNDGKHLIHIIRMKDTKIEIDLSTLKAESDDLNEPDIVSTIG